MDQYKHRRWTRIIAVLDFVFTMANVILIFVLSALCINYQTEGADPEQVFTAMWILNIILMIQVLIGTHSAIKLGEDATEKGVNPAEVLRKAKFWRVNSIVNTVVGGCFYAATLRIIHLVLFIVIKGIFLYRVGKYIEELHTAKDAMGEVQYQRNVIVAPTYGFRVPVPVHQKV